MRVWPFGGEPEGQGWRPRNCSPESSALFAELLLTLAPAAELDMVEARDTLWPESFITMASQSRKKPPSARGNQAAVCETRGGKSVRKASAGRFAGCWAELQAAHDSCVFGGEPLFELGKK